MPPLPFPFAGILGGAFPFDDGDGDGDRRGGAHEVEGGVFGPMAGVFKGLFDFARELERMERMGMEQRRPEGDVGGGGAPVSPRADNGAGGLIDAFFRRGGGEATGGGGCGGGGGGK